MSSDMYLQLRDEVLDDFYAGRRKLEEDRPIEERRRYLRSESSDEGELEFMCY